MRRSSADNFAIYIGGEESSALGVREGFGGIKLRNSGSGAIGARRRSAALGDRRARNSQRVVAADVVEARSSGRGQPSKAPQRGDCAAGVGGFDVRHPSASGLTRSVRPKTRVSMSCAEDGGIEVYREKCGRRSQ